MSAEEKDILYWYNFVTGKMDAREELPATDEEAKKYISQNPSAQGLYETYRAMGKSIIDAMVGVYQAFIQQSQP